MQIHVDSGILFGLGFFETLEVRNHTPIFLEFHLQRLHRSCTLFHLPKISPEEVYQYIEAVDISSPYVLRLTVTEKNSFFTHRPHPYLERTTPMKVKISSLRRNPRDLMIYHKSIQYYQNIYEKQKWAAKGFDEVLFLNVNDSICEGSVSNIFWIHNNVLYTPSVGSGLLAGILRNWVIAHANILHIPVVKGQFALSSLQNADAVFLTNSIMGIQRVSQIENVNCNCEPHPLLQQLKESYGKIKQEIDTID